jgi:hypothetical protein
MMIVIANNSNNNNKTSNFQNNLRENNSRFKTQVDVETGPSLRNEKGLLPLEAFAWTTTSRKVTRL